MKTVNDTNVPSIHIRYRISITSFLLLIVACSCNSASFQILNATKVPDTSAGYLSFVVIGDYGYEGFDVQRRVAKQMDVWAEKAGASLVVSVGDNFYAPDGVADVWDSNWKTHWGDIYKTGSTPYLRNLPWHALLGNHDYCRNTKAQIEYKSKGWRMDDFFWVHDFRVGSKTGSFVYLDTNLLAYGKETQPWLQKDCPNMRNQFYQFGWDVNQMASIAEAKLEYVKDRDWIVVFAHHPIGGGSCGAEGDLWRVKNMVDRYRVSAYMCGHVHNLEYNESSNVSHIISGAGGRNDGKGCTGNSMWSKDKVGGFVGVKMTEEQMTFEFIDEYGNMMSTFTRSRR
ncbi:Metallo-dependent phosphatase-like protein [Paraphysoderma sedebokerense]|nr:Metallo-dependent phosphatase-like protein [Paraphysoderma sedebokerense]